jgi:hypothetical protein
VSWRDRVRAERRARDTARLSAVLRDIGPGACPWCYAAAVTDWDYEQDRPLIWVEHDRRCLGPSSRWHRRAASDWLMALLRLHGYGVADYGDEGLARHRTVRCDV